eukprot:TRINITY_DN53315_c0_g1_i1.p1 TRINITY_DN53315_c0_g1~~TRINITY_DN53315_c0_g1_i1.p1  ORF type:complete len:394 (+),score=79.28 TRINITY_DN53315_c0_g1_i1:148-1182(+)
METSGSGVGQLRSTCGDLGQLLPKKEAWPEVPTFGAEPSPIFRSAALAVGGETRRRPGGDVSEGPSESSVNVEDTEDECLQNALPGLERFYEKMAAKAQLASHPGTGASSSWVLNMARSYRRLSKEKRRRGRLKELLKPAGQSVLGSASGGLACPKMQEHLGWSSNTDDSGYEAGYETDADESELSEWENGTSRRQGHKRKLEALVNLTMQMSFGPELPSSQAHEDATLSTRPTPPKTPRAFGTQPIGLRLSLPEASTIPRLPNSGTVGGLPRFRWPQPELTLGSSGSQLGFDKLQPRLSLQDEVPQRSTSSCGPQQVRKASIVATSLNEQEEAKNGPALMEVE